MAATCLGCACDSGHRAAGSVGIVIEAVAAAAAANAARRRVNETVVDVERWLLFGSLAASLALAAAMVYAAGHVKVNGFYCTPAY